VIKELKRGTDLLNCKTVPFFRLFPAGDRQTKESRNSGFDRRLYSKKPIHPGRST
jgi:hypothetical protein